jgi:hypothetical protein
MSLKMIMPSKIVMPNHWTPRQFYRLSDFFLIAALCAASFAAVLRFGSLPRDPMSGVAVVFAPWTTADQTFTRAVTAGARFVRFGAFDFIAIVKPDDPGYVGRVLSDQAILVVDPQVLAGCLPASWRHEADAR